MLLPAMIVRFYQGWLQMLLIDLPLFLAYKCSISSFYLVAQRELRPKTWWRTFLYMPFVMATGIGISVRNAQAVIEALLGKKSELPARPNSISKGSRARSRKNRTGTKPAGCPMRSVLLGLYFSLTIIYAIANEKLRHRPVPAALCLGLPVHRLHVPRPNVLRASRFGRQRTGNAPRHVRRSGILTIFATPPMYDAVSQVLDDSLFSSLRPGKAKSSGNRVT